MLSRSLSSKQSFLAAVVSLLLLTTIIYQAGYHRGLDLGIDLGYATWGLNVDADGGWEEQADGYPPAPAPASFPPGTPVAVAVAAGERAAMMDLPPLPGVEDQCMAVTRGMFEAVEELGKNPFGVVVHELGIHDEVVGAVAYTLRQAGIDPFLNYFPRFSFPSVLSSIAPQLRIETPHGEKRKEWLRESIVNGSVEHLVLTTCTATLPDLLPTILLSPTLHVHCVIHHSGPDLYHKFKRHLEPLAKADRLTLIVLGEHVNREVRRDIQDWAEKEEEGAWEGLQVKTLLPIFDYPGNVPREDAIVFPSQAAVQGNIEHGRRNYVKLFANLVASLEADPALWGYQPISAPGEAYLPLKDPSASPFHLSLVGQKPAGSTIEIPRELDNIVSIHEKLSYPDYYSLLSSMDIIVPAFAQSSTYVETTSSSIAAGAIVRVPILASLRHLQSYTYLNPPAMVPRDISMSEIEAIAQMRNRSASQWKRAPDSEWEAFQRDITEQNVCMWQRILSPRERKTSFGRRRN